MLDSCLIVTICAGKRVTKQVTWASMLDRQKSRKTGVAKLTYEAAFIFEHSPRTYEPVRYLRAAIPRLQRGPQPPTPALRNSALPPSGDRRKVCGVENWLVITSRRGKMPAIADGYRQQGVIREMPDKR